MCPGDGIPQLHASSVVMLVGRMLSLAKCLAKVII